MKQSLLTSPHDRETTLNMRTRWMLGVAAIIVAVIVARVSLTADAAVSPAKAKSLPLVSVTRAKTLDLPIRFSVQGHLVALNQVDVRPQVTGTIRSVHFHEGDEVRQGQLLFVLDASDADAQLHRAQAQAAQIKAALDNEQRNQDRAGKLRGSGYISSSEMDTIASKVEVLQAQWRAARADGESAGVQVGRTRILSPIAGRTGAVSVHPGTLAQQGGVAPLVNLVQLDPIGVEFSLPERALGGLLRANAAGLTRVSVVDADAETIQGELNFINNTVNTGTGTISLKAHFANARHRLWPGAFVRVTLDAGADKGVVVLPPQAVLEGPEGHFVFQVGVDGRAVARPVTLLRVQDQHAVVEGLQSGEQVVVEGNRDLRNGTRIAIASRPAAPAAPVGAPAEAVAR